MKLAWYFNRLRNMQPAEIVHRLGEKWRKTRSRRDVRGWQAYGGASLSPVFRDLREKVEQASQAQRQAIAVAAERALAGQYSALGADWPARSPEALFPDDLWRLDPISGLFWPGGDTYTFDIDYRHNATRGDIKYVWEIGRLQQLPVLAAHTVLTADAAAIAAIEEAIASWQRSNPPFRGVGWASGIEVALRAISLIVTVDLLEHRLSTDARSRISAILAASAYWLCRFPSKYSSANNHLVAELAGEYLIALALGAPADRFMRALSDETVRQILPDGAPAEQSPTYGAFTAEMILLAMLAGRDRGESFGQDAQARLATFAGFVEWLPSGWGFGDDDEGRTVTLGDEADYPRSVAASIRGLFAQAGQAAPADDFRALFFGTPVAEAAPVTGLTTFDHGGLSLWRGEIAGRDVDMTFDHGPLGYLSIAAHGHADALALSLRLDGLPVLVDPGTWLYGSGGIWRSWFRSTPAHNTLNIDGQSQSIMSGAFNWSHKARTTLLSRQTGPDWSLEAQHDGYLKRFGALHRRRIGVAGDDIIVADSLIGPARIAEIVFQLADGLTAETTAEAKGSRIDVLREGKPILQLFLAEGEISVTSGGDRPGEGGWVSPRFGRKVPAPRISWRGSVGPDPVRTVLTVVKS